MVVVLDGTKHMTRKWKGRESNPESTWRCRLCLWGSGLEDEEGEGSWKPAAGARSSTLEVDTTHLGKVVGFVEEG